MYYTIKLFFITIALFLTSFYAFAQDNQPPVYEIYDKDEAMNTAIITARKNLDSFKYALLSDYPSYGFFSIKVKMKYKRKIEHIWLTNIQCIGGKYVGVVDNVPVSIKNVNIGDSIVIASEDITDWFYIVDDKLIGGYTIRVLRDKMSVKERKQFDDSFGVILSD